MQPSPIAGTGQVSPPHHPTAQLCIVLILMPERNRVHLSPYCLWEVPRGLGVILIANTEVQSLSMALNFTDSSSDLGAISSNGRKSHKNTSV